MREHTGCWKRRRESVGRRVNDLVSIIINRWLEEGREGPDFHDLAKERDDALIKGLCQASRTTRMELREWAETELKAVLVEA